MTGWTFDHRTGLSAPPAAVFAALTEPAALAAWFAEHVDIDLRAGGRFAFHGRYTLGTPGPREALQVVRSCEPPRTLGVDWPIDGVRTTLDFTLDAKDAGTTLHVRHHFPHAPPAPTLVDDWWRCVLGNLQAWLGGGQGTVRVDLTDPTPRVDLSIVIAAPRAAVWRALTDPAQLDQWIAAAAQVDPRAGGHYRYGWKYEVDGRKVEGGPTRILECVELEKLVTDWPDWRGEPGRPDTRVTWLLADVEGGTRVTLQHEGFDHPARVSDYPFGWGYFLGRLESLFKA
jgi:uncharacterized protein YndB with AHSA1/START domain